MRWSSDRDPGLRRRRCGAGFCYRDVDGRLVRDAEVLQRIRRLAIPPAYRDVWICAHGDGHLQATGRDARGRKQYRYHPQWREARDSTKFDRLREFGRVLPRLRRRVQRALAQAAAPSRGAVLASMVRLLDTTWLRIGNTEYQQSNGSFGLSTLRKRHAVTRGALVELAFVGKSGVRQRARLEDRRVARIVRGCQDLPGQRLFHYVDANGSPQAIGSSDVNAWLAEACGEAFTAKDFRTWHGTVAALALARRAARGARDAPGSPTAVIAEVARRLGNTAAVCRKAYIHPAVLDRLDGLCTTPAAATRPSSTTRGLSLAENDLLHLLDGEARATRRKGQEKRSRRRS